MRGALLFALAMICSQPGQANAQAEDLQFAVVVKSSNYAQRTEGTLELLNYHFFSEIFLKPDGKVKQATLAPLGAREAPWQYANRGPNYYFEGGHFDSLAEVDAAFPNGAYIIDIDTPSGSVTDRAMILSGSGGKSEIPGPVRIRLWQEGVEVSPDRIDPDRALRITWGQYRGARADPNGIVDDMVFVVVADCHGERIVHSGLPFVDESYLTFRTTEYVVPAGTLNPGEPHSMFVELPHAMQTQRAGGVPLFTSYATATYLDLHTLGDANDSKCPSQLPPMDTGQTDRMDEQLRSHTRPPAIEEQIVMFYYENIEAPAQFYHDLLGLQLAFSDDWVRIYKITDSSSIGVVRAGPGAYHEPQGRNAVMLSIVTNDVEAWYRRLKGAGSVKILKELDDNPSAPIRSFLVADPGGYTVEFFEWRDEQSD